jgi:hypothetical protein
LGRAASGLHPAQRAVQMEAIALGGEVIHLNEDELKMHPVEVFDVDRPWESLKSRLPKNP